MDNPHCSFRKQQQGFPDVVGCLKKIPEEKLALENCRMKSNVCLKMRDFKYYFSFSVDPHHTLTSKRV